MCSFYVSLYFFFFFFFFFFFDLIFWCRRHQITGGITSVQCSAKWRYVWQYYLIVFYKNCKYTKHREHRETTIELHLYIPYSRCYYSSGYCRNYSPAVIHPEKQGTISRSLSRKFLPFAVRWSVKLDKSIFRLVSWKRRKKNYWHFWNCNVMMKSYQFQINFSARIKEKVSSFAFEIIFQWWSDCEYLMKSLKNAWYEVEVYIKYM